MSGRVSGRASDGMSGRCPADVRQASGSVSGLAVGCMSASLLGHREGSRAAPSVAAYGCVGVSLLGQVGRQQGHIQDVVWLGWVG